ncbi:MAG: SHOCT domain-containing protein [Clostridia bacterium]|nr:SHOCT domain-containing protein [Clostridia bacterium]
MIVKQENPQSNADELKEYKDLLDAGILTQEEFDAKKKQLLGL